LQKIDELLKTIDEHDFENADANLTACIIEMLDKGEKEKQVYGPDSGYAVIQDLIKGHVMDFDGYLVDQKIARTLAVLDEVDTAAFVAATKASINEDEEEDSLLILLRLSLPAGENCDVGFVFDENALDEAYGFDCDLLEYVRRIEEEPEE